MNIRGITCGVIAKLKGKDLEVSKFKIQLSYNVLSRTNAHEKKVWALLSIIKLWVNKYYNRSSSSIALSLNNP